MDAATRKVFEQLCTHVKTKGTDATMTRAELQKAAGLSEQDFMIVLRGLRGPNNDQDISVCFVEGDWDKLTLGIRWRQDCGVK
jgi:orotidine-5'-phosphate decarboxylase